MDTGEHRRQILVGFNIINTNDGNVLGDLKAAFLKCPHSANGGIVISTKNCRNVGA